MKDFEVKGLEGKGRRRRRREGIGERGVWKDCEKNSVVWDSGSMREDRGERIGVEV